MGPQQASSTSWNRGIAGRFTCHIRLSRIGGVPVATSTKTNSKCIEVKTRQAYGRFDRVYGACISGEGGQTDAVFLLRQGTTLRNTIIGKNQKEGVYCHGPCTLEFAWFEDVYEDVISACKRNVYVEGVNMAYGGGEIVGINSNYGDTAVLRNVFTDARVKCEI
ncbi:pectin lyase-like protein [Colletotrichum falcatum]|nr:pectin lyase-like protein [Colletotrichum falcatum]